MDATGNVTLFIGTTPQGQGHETAAALVAGEHLDELCPDWRDRETYACGPAELLDALTAHWEQGGDPERLHMERFQPKLGLGRSGEGKGGTIKFLSSDLETESDGHMPILVEPAMLSR